MLAIFSRNFFSSAAPPVREIHQMPDRFRYSSVHRFPFFLRKFLNFSLCHPRPACGAMSETSRQEEEY